MPFVSARASVWQAPHLATNCCLPTIRLAFSPCLADAAGGDERSASSRPAVAAVRPSAARAPARRYAHPRRERLASIGVNTDPRARAFRAGTLCRTPGVAQGVGERVQLAAAPPRSRPARRPPTTSARAPSRRARRASARAAPARLQPRRRYARRARARRRRRPGTTATARPAAGTAPASTSLTSARPECAALIGSAPQAAASAATMPNASGNVLGTTSASHAGSSSASSSWSRRPVSTTRSGRARAAVR